MRCPNCDYDNVIGASYCAWCKKPVPATPKPLHHPAKEAPPPPKPPVPEVEEPSLPGARYYALIGALFAIVANCIFLIPWEHEMQSRYDVALESTSILVAAIGYFYCRKIALTRYLDKAMSAGSRGGALIGTVNGTVVFPVIGTVIGAVLGAIIGTFVAGPLAFYLIKFFRWMSLGWTDTNTGTERSEQLPPPPPIPNPPLTVTPENNRFTRSVDTTIPVQTPAQAKYLALIGCLIAMIINDILANVYKSEIEKVFSPATFPVVRLLIAAMSGIIGYYHSYKIAQTPTVRKALSRGALTGFFAGAVVGYCVLQAAGALIGAAIGIPIGAICGCINLVILDSVTKKDYEEWTPHP
jgi:uncharacterized membrane protein